MKTWVYFIAAGPFIKIGLSKTPLTRMEELQPWNPYPLELAFAVPGDRQAEMVFHLYFYDCWHRGEWFRNEGSLKAFLDIIPAVTVTEEDGAALLKAATESVVARAPFTRHPKSFSLWSKPAGPRESELIVAEYLKFTPPLTRDRTEDE